MKSTLTLSLIAITALWQIHFASALSIPLPEHPRPDAHRAEWVNLNGIWQFAFDSADTGEAEGWFADAAPFTERILVPYSWGSALSGVGNEAEIAWYRRSIRVPESWRGRRVFLVIGACDWHTTGWLDGAQLGSHKGGYTPFEFELTELLGESMDHELVLRVDDRPHPFKLYGKQGYGEAKGIWQTVYLEARGPVFLRTFHFSPDIDRGQVSLVVETDRPPGQDAELELSIRLPSGRQQHSSHQLRRRQARLEIDIPLSELRLWTLDDPWLYDVDITLKTGDAPPDQVQTYFGMRKIGVVNLPGTDMPYVALNNEPVYLRLALDQAYHPEGYYTFPDDDFVRDEIIRSKKIGLNGQRVHVKIAHPRKLYWADRLGLLIMADVPNSWGEPDTDMRSETEYALRGMIHRDFNHPSVFSWVIFNETWGLFTRDDQGQRVYSPETQRWVVSMYRLAKSLDPTRLVEDNSPCNYDHTETDLNTWHAYLPGYAWGEFLENACRNTYPGSEWNFADGYRQGRQPMLNSECGNVWGYEGSTGDVDWSWDYHIMMNQFQKHPRVAGWLYTEHHDVVNEWNGYYRFDRSEKQTGLEELMPGMRLNDLHSDIYLLPDLPLSSDHAAGARVAVPLWLSVFTASPPAGEAVLEYRLRGYDMLGEELHVPGESRTLALAPWSWGTFDTVYVDLPGHPGLYQLELRLSTKSGKPIHHNFCFFLVKGPGSGLHAHAGRDGNSTRVLSFLPNSFARAHWSEKLWTVLDGLKVNGAGAGYFEYEVAWPETLQAERITEAHLRMELSAKPLLGKDRSMEAQADGDYMRGGGLHDPGRNPNAYPMTDDRLNPSQVQVFINDRAAGWHYLPDDPADHRGVLSWHSQPKDRKLREAGTYGYLVRVPLSEEHIASAREEGKFRIRLQVDGSLAGGLAVYGAEFGRYPLDPGIVFFVE